MFYTGLTRNSFDTGILLQTELFFFTFVAFPSETYYSYYELFLQLTSPNTVYCEMSSFRYNMINLFTIDGRTQHFLMHCFPCLLSIMVMQGHPDLYIYSNVMSEINVLLQILMVI